MGLRKFGKWVGKGIKKVVDTGKKVVNKVVDTVSNLLKDPKAVMVLAINIMAPGAGSAIGAAMGLGSGMAASFVGNTILNTALNGGDIKAAAI
jgi:hypothetical protein